MELYVYKLPARKQGEPSYIAPIGDIQWSGSKGPTASDTLKRHIDRCLQLGAHFIGMGDYIDFMSPSNRQRLLSAAFYDTTKDSIDEKGKELVADLFARFLKPTVGRWIGLLEGHHYLQLSTGITTDQYLCELLKTKFLGTSAYVKMVLEYNNTHANVVLAAHHGIGGGMTAGAPLNRLQQWAEGLEGADVYLMGHTAKAPNVPTDRIVPVWHGNGAPRLKTRTVRLVNTGGFSTAYTAGSKQGRVPRGGYVEQRMLKPAHIGAPLIEVRVMGRYVREGAKETETQIKVIV